MPGEKKKAAGKAAKVEDYDSDESCVVPGTAVRASSVSERPPPLSSRSIKIMEHRYSTPASDSGYSSYRSAPQKVPAPPVKPVEALSRRSVTTNSSPARSRPLVAIHNEPSRKTQTVEASSRHVSACDDPNCRDPTCDRRYTLAKESGKATQPHYQRDPQYRYATASQAAAMMPPPPRPRTASMSRARPASTFGYPISSALIPQSSAPVPSPYHYQQYPLRPLSGHYSAAVNAGAYPPPSPTSPTYTSYPTYASDPITFSARQLSAALPGVDPLQPVPWPAGKAHVSARQARGNADPEPESAEDSTSEGYTSEEERHHRRSKSPRRSQLREEFRVEDPLPSRPTHKKYHTETSITQRSRRDHRPQPDRAPRSDQDLHYLSSDARNDSDRTARADVGTRPINYSSRSSRRSSVATSSSSRTKTTQSSNTDYSTYEDRAGRRRVYLSEDEHRARRRQQQKHLADLEYEDRIGRAAAYQRNTGGGGFEPHELTAENIRKKEARKSASHVSGRSQKTSGSSTRDGGGGGGVKIQSGETVLHVYGQANIEMRQNEDGGTAFVIAPSGREKSYQGSKSSGSRSARDRGRSDVTRRAIREENSFDEAGYEIPR